MPSFAELHDALVTGNDQLANDRRTIDTVLSLQRRQALLVGMLIGTLEELARRDRALERTVLDIELPHV